MDVLSLLWILGDQLNIIDPHIKPTVHTQKGTVHREHLVLGGFQMILIEAAPSHDIEEDRYGKTNLHPQWDQRGHLKMGYIENKMLNDV